MCDKFYFRIIGTCILLASLYLPSYAQLTENEGMSASGRAMLPIRALADAFGMTIRKTGNLVEMSSQKHSAKFYLYKKYASVDGIRVDLFIPAYTYMDITYIPIGAIKNAFGYSVEQKEGSNAITITDNTVNKVMEFNVDTTLYYIESNFSGANIERVYAIGEEGALWVVSRNRIIAQHKFPGLDGGHPPFITGIYSARLSSARHNDIVVSLEEGDAGISENYYIFSLTHSRLTNLLGRNKHLSVITRDGVHHGTGGLLCTKRNLPNDIVLYRSIDYGIPNTRIRATWYKFNGSIYIKYQTITTRVSYAIITDSGTNISELNNALRKLGIGTHRYNTISKTP